MQRTVKETRFTYAKTELDTEGKLVATLATVTVPESEPKKAYKEAVKKVGPFAPLKTETLARLYVLDDEIFFKYAKVLDDEDTADTETEE